MPQGLSLIVLYHLTDSINVIDFSSWWLYVIFQNRVIEWSKLLSWTKLFTFIQRYSILILRIRKRKLSTILLFKIFLRIYNYIIGPLLRIIYSSQIIIIGLINSAISEHHLTGLLFIGFSGATTLHSTSAPPSWIVLLYLYWHTTLDY